MKDIAALIDWGDSETTMPPGAIAIYGLLDPIDGAMRYVGQTHNPMQRYLAHLKTTGAQCNPAKARWIQMLLQQGVYPRMKIFGVVNRKEAHDLEMLVIGDHLPYGLLKNQRVPTRSEHRARAMKHGWPIWYE